jgi:hypothetical protein
MEEKRIFEICGGRMRMSLGGGMSWGEIQGGISRKIYCLRGALRGAFAVR